MCFWVYNRTYLMSSSLHIKQCQHVSIVLLGSFERWEVRGRTATVLWDAASMISPEHLAFLSSSHLAFFLCVLLESSWCILTLVLTRLQLGRNFILSKIRIRQLVNSSLGLRLMYIEITFSAPESYERIY